jgi:hypothetical protein
MVIALHGFSDNIPPADTRLCLKVVLLPVWVDATRQALVCQADGSLVRESGMVLLKHLCYTE